MSLDYTNKVRDHFIKPLHLGVIADSTGTGEIGNKICGDTVRMHVKISNDVLEDVKFQTFGCVYSVACADELADIAKGKKVSEAKKIVPNDVVVSLGGIPDSKKHCSVMAVNAFRSALKNAGQNIELLQGAKELSDKADALKIPLSIQKKHLIAELFDDFIIPELKKKNVAVELLNVDIDSHKCKVSTDSSTIYAKKFTEDILRKYVDSSLVVDMI